MRLFPCGVVPPYTTITPTYNTILDRTLHFSRHNILLDAALTPRVADVGFVTPMPVKVGSTVIITQASVMTLPGTEDT